VPAQLSCIDAACGASVPIDQVLYACPRCGALLAVEYPGLHVDPAALKRTWRERRTSNAPLDQSGVWRYRELIPFLDFDRHAVATLREGNTPLLAAPRAADYAGLDTLVFKHQGFNPTGSFKDNGMTCGASQALRLGLRRVACVSTGNTSASMAAYAAVAGLTAVIFLPHGNISFGKLAQALEYGALTLQVEANFDQILALVRVLAEKTGIYLLNSMNPFRLEGQKTIMVEMLDQRDWRVPDWVVVPGGNLGNVSAFGKGLRELLALHRPTAQAGRDSGRRLGAVVRLLSCGCQGRIPGGSEPRDAGHGNPHRRSGFVAQGDARNRRVGRHGGTRDGAGNR
jgi:threonine synthase